ncbi:MAG: MoxR family ATPase [Lachnospiraceae bacterium]|nr:MoxR family ATPase [Lachnospiraceae bacterium]
MNIRRAKEEIRNTIIAYLKKDALGEYEIPYVRQRPVLLIGPPGIGKTAIISQIAEECGVALVSYTITHHTRQSAIGLPFIEKKLFGGKEYSITEYTMSEIVASIYNKIEATGLPEGILFIDEINCVSETLAPTMLQFLQEKRFGNHRIPEGWVIIAAGNPPEYNKAVRDFDVVTLDRVRKIDVEEDFNSWKAYAYENRIHGAVIAYLEARKENFYSVETTVDGKNIVTARGWDDLSGLMKVYDESGIQVNYDVVIQYIQNPRIARDFANFADLYRKYASDYNVDEILEGRIRESSCERLRGASFDEKLSVISLLTDRLSSSFSEVYQRSDYVNRLFEVLKRAGSGIKEKSAEDVLGSIKDEQSKLYAFLELEQEKGTSDRNALRAVKRVIATLDSYMNGISSGHYRSGEDAFDYVRGEFSKETEELEEVTDKGEKYLAGAFSFMELTFGESQEMVIFMTGLNASPSAVRFIRENGSEQYDRYNRSLLFDEKRREVLKEMEDIGS